MYELILNKLHRLERVPYRPDTWTCSCPNSGAHKHGDRSRSARAWIGRNGSLLLKCWGCRASLERMAAALGVPVGEFFPPDPDRQRKWRARVMQEKIAACYRYEDADGNLLYEKLRYEPKTFRFRRYENGEHRWDRGPERVIYRLPHLLGFLFDSPDAWVFVCEGEKDTDAVWSLGLPATTNDDGAGNWADADSQFLIGRKCCILEDNDQAGRDRSKAVAGSLLCAGAAAIRVLRLPGLPAGGDVSDWLEQFNNGSWAWQKAEALTEAMYVYSSVFWHRSTKGSPHAISQVSAVSARSDAGSRSAAGTGTSGTS